MQDFPFLALTRTLEKTGSARHLRPDPDAPVAPLSSPAGNERGPAALSSDRQVVFDAAVKAVQTGFKHLSTVDIAFPPQHMFDAKLARQIAVHITIRELHVSIRGLAREQQRNKGSIVLALQKVRQRLRSKEFAAAYADMAERAAAILREREGGE